MTTLQVESTVTAVIAVLTSVTTSACINETLFIVELFNSVHFGVFFFLSAHNRSLLEYTSATVVGIYSH
jgi:hypothetical protein